MTRTFQMADRRPRMSEWQKPDRLTSRVPSDGPFRRDVPEVTLPGIMLACVACVVSAIVCAVALVVGSTLLVCIALGSIFGTGFIIRGVFPKRGQR